jgi:hypothetical protein
LVKNFFQVAIFTLVVKALQRGSEVGWEAAEAFQVLKLFESEKRL